MIDKKEMAKILGVLKRTLERYILKGLPYIRLPSGRLRFDEKEVIDWIKNKE